MVIRTATWLLAAGVLLAGCSAEKSPSVLPPVPRLSPTQPVDSVAPFPVLPPNATAATPEAAGFFAEFYVKSIGIAFQRADDSQLAQYSDPGCGGCNGLKQGIATLRANDERRVGGDYVDVRAISPGFEVPDVVVDITYRRIPGRIVGKDGLVTGSAGPVPLTRAQMRLVRRGAEWIVQGYRVVPT